MKDAAGEVFAIGDTCTHGDISLAEGFVEDDARVLGPRVEVLARTGKPLTPSAYEPVPVFQVEVKDGGVHIDPSVTLTV